MRLHRHRSGSLFSGLACPWVLLLWVSPLPVLAEDERGGTKFFFEKPMLLGAHRGGLRLWPEETLLAYKSCSSLWPDVVLEGDAHLTADGVVVLNHDATVDRTTNGHGRVDRITWSEIEALDAGYRFTRDGGKTFPFRGKGLKIAKLGEVLASIPSHRFQIEIKGNSKLAEAVVKVVLEARAEDRVMLAAVDPAAMMKVRTLAPRIPTCYDIVGANVMIRTLREGDWKAYVPTDDVLAFSSSLMKTMRITPMEFKAIREKGIRIQFFTVNKRDEMSSLLALGADGILTDAPDVLAEVIASREGENSPAAEDRQSPRPSSIDPPGS
ncbi:MAG: glycerophosphodiester phosphodiesterase family protein [Planctomycetota bacterium]